MTDRWPDDLVQKGALAAAALEEARARARDSGESLGRALVALGHVRDEDVALAIAEEYGLEVYRFDGASIAPEVLASVPLGLVQAHRCVPVARKNGCLRVAMSDPTARNALEEVGFAAGLSRVEPVLAVEGELLRAIERYYGVTVERMLEDMSDDGGEGGAEDEYFIHDLQEKASEPTLVNLVNLIISQAIETGVSDIHIEPFEDEMKVKYRIDGILHEITPPPKHLQPAIVSRVKIMAGMDIAKRHVPQDGHIRINHPGAQVDVRVATLPTIFGESVVLRLLNKSQAQISLQELGFSEETFNRFCLLLERSHGIVLVCGPTGSGKTTTLYAALSKIYTPEKKIITIEDPVEYQLQGVNQIPVRESRGVSFASGLRAILRQDPDILMVGEIRDLETAEIAIRGALTGHLIFSTLHTNDAPGAVTRLLDMGVEPFLIASSLQGVAAQRLVRRLCSHCRRPIANPDPAFLAEFGRTPADLEGHTLYGPVGCERCRGWGYAGRVAIAELLLMNDALQHAILNREPSRAIQQTATANMRSMREEGWLKVLAGVTSFDEVLRQTQREQIEQ